MICCNPEFDIDQFLEGGAYIVGPSPLAAYTVDGVRVQISSAAASQVSVSRKSPGLFGSKYCFEAVTAISKTSMGDADSDNFEITVTPDDTRGWLWGTPYAQPVTLSLDIQAAVGGDYAVGMADWDHSVHCLNKFTIPGGGAPRSRARR